MKKVAKTSDGDNLASATEANKGGGSGQAPSEGCSPCSTKSDVLESTARNSDSSSEDGVADHEDSSLINHACGFGSDALGDAADPPPSTTTGTPLLGPTQASAMVVNYISMGYVLLPYAFYTAGIVFSVIVLAVVALQSYITSIFILESYARAERLNEHSFPSGGGMRLRDQYDKEIRQSQMYELSGLQKTFLGTRWTQFFTAVTACDLYTISWTLAVIFGQALSAHVSLPGFDETYQLWLGVFMLITIPLSCTKILDQALLQFVFLACRLLMVVLMLGTLVAGFVSGNRHFGEQMGPANDTQLFNLKNTMTIVQVAIFSTAFQFSVPSLVGITNRKENCTPSSSSSISSNDNNKDSKNNDVMSAILRNAVFFVYATNSLLAIMTAVYFGSSTNPSSNLNWSNYHGGGTEREVWSKFVSGYITMFAAIDGLAIFPLLCSTLGGILVQAVTKSTTAVVVFDEEVKNDRKRQIFFRLLAALPPSIAALFFQYLHVIAKYGCIFTMLSYSAAPAFLYLASGTKMEELQLSKATVYTSRYFSHNWVAYSILVLTFLAILGVIVDAVVYA